MKLRLTRTVLSLSALALFAAGGLLSTLVVAGPLDPPAGLVAPTFKTLSEVEPRIAINPTNTPGDADSMFKITQPGSYYLTGNIQFPGGPGKHGIEIVASGVTLDLNGFDVVGVFGAGSFDGVSVTLTNQTNVAVVNGSVRNWGRMGVNLGSTTTSGRVEGVLVGNSNGNGILIGSNSTISRCSAFDNNAAGLVAGDGCNISHFTARGNANIGIFTGFGCTVTNCSAVVNSNSGIFTGFGCTIAACSAFDNLGTGITTGSQCVVTDCAANLNSTLGIFVGTDCTITGCTVTGNTNGGITSGGRGNILKSNISNTGAGPGVTSTGEGLRIESSTINGNGTLGVFANTGTISELAVVNCTIRNNGTGGINSRASTQILDSLVTGNTGPGISVTSSNLIRGCTINSNTLSGVELTGNANVVQNNTLSSNADVLATAAGVLVQGTDNTIDGNRLYSNTQGGIKLNTSGNLVLRNYLARTGATITAVGGNAVAQILTPGAGFISTDPNANLTY